MMLEEGLQDPSKLPYCPNAQNDATCCFLDKFDDQKVNCCQCARKQKASPLTCLAICFLVLTYNLLGGFLFLALEGDYSVESVAASKPNLSQAQGSSNDLRSKTVERLWSITEDLNILYKENWTKLAAKELMDFQKVLMKTMRGNVLENRLHVEHEPDYRWTFSSSFLYALTLITTIGHGSMAPRSAAGKLVAVAYACVGIPLVMLYLAAAGDALAGAVQAAWSRLRPPAKRCPRRQPTNPPAGLDKPNQTPFQAALNLEYMGGRRACAGGCRARVPAPVGALLLLGYVLLGGAVFRATERWGVVDGCYFSFSSLATIGFGAMRPGAAGEPAAADAARAACCAYILAGVAVAAGCFNLVRHDAGAALAGVARRAGGRPRAVHSVPQSSAALSGS